ncbi:MAG TPA: site-2 protease family protein [Firmicutes bacterium]|nr:site-2 protease family protein [Bacillota bacterium]
MIEAKIGGVKVQFTFFFFAILTLFLLSDRTGLTFWGILAALMHEGGHILAFILTGNIPKKISFDLCGIRIVEAGPYASYRQEAVILAAGSLVNLCCFLLLYWQLGWKFSQIAVLHLVLGIFNLLPIWSLDGGKLVHLICMQFCSMRTANWVTYLLSGVTLLLLLGASIWHLRIEKNFSLLMVSGFLLFSLWKEIKK